MIMTKIFIIVDPDTSLILHANETADQIVQQINAAEWDYPELLVHSLLDKPEFSLKAVRYEDWVFAILEYQLPVKYTNADQTLTRRQRQVLRLVSEGLSNKQIAHKLKLSQRMVNKHLAAIKSKFGTNSTAQSVSKGTELGYCRQFMRRRWI